ncbi:MAG: protein kinase domain-containing protein, partial [Planctomycetota bacterium]
MFTDIVGSVDLKTRFGDSEAAKLIGRHDELFKREVGASPNAEILKDTGDGFLAQFATTSDAVVAALRFQYALHVEPWDGEPVRVRIGLHLGEVSELDEETPGRPKLSGLAVDLAARIMGLAMPGQILLTRAAFDSARQYVRKHPRVGEEDERPPLRWMAHGPYMFQGSEEAMEVFEVGAQGIAPLSVPVNSEKAQRSVEAEEEETLGWRPGSGLGVPGRDGWVLERHLGEGGFGEVWLAVHKRTGARRVFKFCYDVEKLRSFKRELAIVRLLRETLGDRPDIARMYEVRLDDPPFYLESEYTSEGSLVDWASRQEGGVGGIPLPTRLDLVARVADAVAAAHSVGVLHKDL